MPSSSYLYPFVWVPDLTLSIHTRILSRYSQGRGSTIYDHRSHLGHGSTPGTIQRGDLNPNTLLLFSSSSYLATQPGKTRPRHRKLPQTNINDKKGTKNNKSTRKYNGWIESLCSFVSFSQRAAKTNLTSIAYMKWCIILQSFCPRRLSLSPKHSSRSGLQANKSRDEQDGQWWWWRGKRAESNPKSKCTRFYLLVSCFNQLEADWLASSFKGRRIKQSKVGSRIEHTRSGHCGPLPSLDHQRPSWYRECTS